MGKRRKFYDLTTRSYWTSDESSIGTSTEYLKRLDSDKRKDIDSAKDILLSVLSETEKLQEAPLLAIIAEHFDDTRVFWSPLQIFELAMKEFVLPPEI